MQNPVDLSSESPTIQEAQEKRDRALVQVEENAGQKFQREAKAFILKYLTYYINASGEDITDACKKEGIVPLNGDRAFGPAFMALVRQKKIMKSGTALRRKGNASAGATVWSLFHEKSKTPVMDELMRYAHSASGRFGPDETHILVGDHTYTDILQELDNSVFGKYSNSAHYADPRKGVQLYGFTVLPIGYQMEGWMIGKRVDIEKALTAIRLKALVDAHPTEDKLRAYINARPGFTL